MDVKDKEKNYFSALYDVVRMVHASLDVSTVLQEIVRAVVETMGGKASAIRLLDARKRSLVMGASFGLSKGYLKKGPVLVKESGIDQKALKGELIYIKNAQTDPDFQYSAGAKAEGIKSVTVAPLVTGKKVIGVLRIYSDRVREFSAQELQFLEAGASLSAMALENARYHQALQTNFDLLVAHKYRLDDN